MFLNAFCFEFVSVSVFLVVCMRYHVLITLFVFLCIVVSNTYCVVFLFFFIESNIEILNNLKEMFTIYKTYMYTHIYSYNMFCFQYLDLFLFHHLFLFIVYPMLSVSLYFQCLLSTSVFSYVYFASVTAAFLFYWINVCFGDFM